MEICLSWEPIGVGVDFGIKTFSGKISFEWAIAKAKTNGLAPMKF